MNTKNIGLLLLFLICSFILTSCFTYGRPESIFVNIVGRDLENFLEHEKEGTVSLENMDLNIIFRRNELIWMEPPERPRRDRYQVSHLILKNLRTSEEIMIHERTYVEKLLPDIENNRLFYTFVERRDGSYKNYLVIFDLEENKMIDTIMILDDIKYQNDDIWLSGGYISNIFFNNIDNEILFHSVFTTKSGRYDGNDYFSLNLNSHEIKNISQDTFQETLSALNISKSAYEHNYNGHTKRLFFIFPFSNYLPANFKHKYNGIYIYDGVNNLRISGRNTERYSNTPLWLENGRYVIIGRYLFDTSGRRQEIQISDGVILGVF